MHDAPDRPALDMGTYRSRPAEVERLESLLRLLPDRSREILEVGSRDGHMTRHLSRRFSRVVGLDLNPPQLSEEGVLSLKGDLLTLPFPEDAFETVLCAEVIEHIPPDSLAQACRELVRVTRGHLVVGVPFEQDLRIAQTTCGRCGTVNPAWGHRNAFDRDRLLRLLAPMRFREADYVGRRRAATNALSVWLLDRVGNPWGTYVQEEPCIGCEHALAFPRTGLLQRMVGKGAVALSRVQTLFTPSKPNWIHVAFSKNGPAMA